MADSGTTTKAGKTTFQEADPAEPIYNRFKNVFEACERCTIERKDGKDWIEIGTLNIGDEEGIDVAREIRRIVDEHASSEGAGHYRWKMWGTKKAKGREDRDVILAQGQLIGGEKDDLEEEQGNTTSILREATKLMGSHNAVAERSMQRNEEHTLALQEKLLGAYEAIGNMSNMSLGMLKAQKELAVEETRLKLELRKMEIDQEDRRAASAAEAVRDEKVFGMLGQLGAGIRDIVLPQVLPALIIKMRVDAAVKAKDNGIKMEDIDPEAAQQRSGGRVVQEDPSKETPKPPPAALPLRTRVKAMLEKHSARQPEIKKVVGAKLINVITALGNSSDDDDERSVCKKIVEIANGLGDAKMKAMGLQILQLIGMQAAQEFAALLEEAMRIGIAALQKEQAS